MYILERLRKAMRRRINRRCRDPIEQHMIVVSFINNIAGLIGMHVFSADYSATNPLFVVVLIDVFLFFCVNLYTLIISFGDLVNFMFCFETILYAGIAFIKIDVFVRHYKTIHELNHFLIEFNRRYRHDPEQRELLMSNTVDLWLLIAVFNICTFVAPILIFSYSLVWTVTIDYVLPFGFLLPTIGFDYFRGFVMNYLFQLLEACLLVPGLMGAMTSIMMFLMNACLQIDMLQLELKRLSKFCAANIDGQHTVEIRKRIHEIIDHHIEHLVYIKKVCSLFELHFFVVLGCIFCQLVSIVVVVVKVPDWYPGYFLFVMLTFELFFSCALGQAVDLKSDELMIAIYNVPWYNMERQDQKAMLMLLIAAQQPGIVSYGFGTVNMRAFFEIYQKTYSIGMMMAGVSEEE